MALNTRLSGTAAKAQLDALRVLANGGKLRIYDGTQPAAGGAITSQVLLAEITLANPAFSAATNDATNATITALGVPLSDTSADASGTATWCRILQSDNTILWDGSVGTATANLIMNSVAISSGATVTISAFTHNLPLQGA